MQQVVRMISILVLITLTGTLLYMLIERSTVVEALYFAMSTITTVGYGDVHPEGLGGRTLAIFLMLGGVGMTLYLYSEVASFVVEGRLRQVLGVRKMKRAIEKMQDHYIICGFGRLGQKVAVELERIQVPFVIIETESSKCADASECGYAVVEGDATHEEVLREAGVLRCAGLTTTISTDAENLYIGIAAHSLCPTLPVVCRSSTDRVRSLFEQAGIKRTISTEEIGARRIVSSLTRPHIVEFMDEMLKYEGDAASLHAVHLPEGAPLVGTTIMRSKIREKFGAVVLAIQREGGVHPNPGPGEELRAGDLLILIGHRKQIEQLQALADSEVGEKSARS